MIDIASYVRSFAKRQYYEIREVCNIRTVGEVTHSFILYLPGVPPTITAPKPPYRARNPSCLYVRMRVSIGPRNSVFGRPCNLALAVSNGWVNIRLIIPAVADPNTSYTIVCGGGADDIESSVEVICSYHAHSMVCKLWSMVTLVTMSASYEVRFPGTVEKSYR